jgi:hypothetical protein
MPNGNINAPEVLLGLYDSNPSQRKNEGTSMTPRGALQKPDHVITTMSAAFIFHQIGYPVSIKYALNVGDFKKYF